MSGLKKSSGNMYPWVTHMHSHLGGECPHRCSYCYVDNPRFGRPKDFTGPLRMIPGSLDVDYGKGRTIFIDYQNDLGADSVPAEWILDVLLHCDRYPQNAYVFQTKNPHRFLNFQRSFPKDCLIGCTIETDREDLLRRVSKAPAPEDRAVAMRGLAVAGFSTFVTIEPIMEFNLKQMVAFIQLIRPKFVNIGADSKGHGLKEPSFEKVMDLVHELRKFTEVREKKNLDRLRR